jgi:hypothetical protein
MNVGITYEIRDKSNPDLVYYGSSELSLDERIKSHLRDYNTWKKTGKNYCSSFKILGQNNYKYDIIDIVYFDTKYELREYERLLIEDQTCVNERIPNRTHAEWLEANPNYNAEWYQNNKDKIKERSADYYQVNKEYFKEYYQQNKEKIKKQYYKKITCPCGGKYTHQKKARHIKSNKHQKWALSQN